MRRAANLRVLDDHAQTKLSRFGRRVALLRRAEDDAGRSLDSHQLETELSHAVINLQSFWSNWCRAYYLSGALGTQSSSGATISSGLSLSNERDALTVAIKGTLTPKHPAPPTWPPYQEPKWFDPNVFTSILTKAQISNSQNISMFVNSVQTPLGHLRLARNYYAHRSDHLKQPVLALGPTYLVGLPNKPSDILLFVEPNRSLSVLERWILDLRRLASAMCI